jgi:hypothetical protein
MLDIDQLFDGELGFAAGGLCRRAARADKQDGCDTDCVYPITHCAPSNAKTKICMPETKAAGGAKVSPNPPNREERFQI